MNKIFFHRYIWIFLFIGSLSSLNAELQTKIEFRSAAFFHSSKLFREIYGNVGTCYEVEIATKCQNCWEIWGNYDYFSKHNHVKGDCCGKTRATMDNVSLGIKYIYPFCNCLEIYAGLGASFGKIRLKNHSCCLNEKESKLCAGLVVKSGILYYVSCNLFVDVFVDYLYEPVHFHHHHSLNIGGTKIGGGIGFDF